MCRLHDEGRDHIWAYYVRNLARPLWLARDKNRVDVLIGNPPWLAYRHMTGDMQKVFRRMSEARGLWAGADLATHQDLSALFVVRAAELYLKKDGRFAMVMPNAAVDREHYAGFRCGHYEDKNGAVAADLAFSGSWDLRRIRPHFFPRGSSVVFGSRAGQAKAMPDTTEYWSGRVAGLGTPWADAREHLQRVNGAVRRVNRSELSHYHAAFTQGAIFAPRLVFFVEKQQSSPLGLPAGRIAVVSSRSTNEKTPWKGLKSLAGVVETEFVRPVLSGESLLPYRVSADLLAVVPCDSRHLLREPGAIELHPGLEHWWRHAEAIWERHRSSERLSLFQQLDYQSKLSKQLPIPTLRVVYNKSGMHLVAAKVTNRRALVSNGLYWASVASEAEADFLCAILNAPAATEAVRPLMSYGKDERDIHKHVWQLPIPQFDTDNTTHQRIVEIARHLEQQVAAYPVSHTLHFAASRRHIRELPREYSRGRRAQRHRLRDVGVKVLHDWPKQHLPATDARIPRMCTTTFARTRACYTAHMPNDTTPDASGDVQTRTEEHHDASGRAPLAPTTQPAPPPPLETESAHTRIDASGRERVRKPPPENWIVIDQAMARFTAAGLPIKLRTLQKYCLREKIRSTLAVTDKNTFKYFLDPASIADFITKESQKVPTENGESEPPPAMRTPDAPAPVRERVRDDLGVFEHPYVKRLEREVDDYKQKYDTLQASARADLIKLHETYAVAQSETLAKYLLLDKGKATTTPTQSETQSSTN